MTQATRHSGGCHCGKVRYEAELDLAHVITCNCSICQKRGHFLTFVPAEGFELKSGEDALVDYQFNNKVIHHLFCGTCGVGSFGRGTNPKDGKAMVAINVRCLDDVDLATIEPTPVDGKNF